MKKKKILRTKNAGNLITNNNNPYYKKFSIDLENFLNSGNRSDEEFYNFMVYETMKLGNIPIEDAIKIVNKSLFGHE